MLIANPSSICLYSYFINLKFLESSQVINVGLYQTKTVSFVYYKSEDMLS